MTDELKPVRCGCGGEALVKKHTFYRALPLYSVKCDRCGIQVPSRNTEAEAITAWNKAMSAKDINVPDKGDLISRQDVIHALELSLENDYIDATEFLAFVKQLPSAEPERRWIPVTERLPEDNRQVLVYAKSTHFVLAKYDEMMEPNGEWKKQWVTFDAWKPYYTVVNVLAWMPLPEPYRGGK